MIAAIIVLLLAAFVLRWVGTVAFDPWARLKGEHNGASAIFFLLSFAAFVGACVIAIILAWRYLP